MRDYLVFFCSGTKSLHAKALAEDLGRNWDCCVSWYSSPGDAHHAEYAMVGKDNKFESFVEFYNNEPNAKKYRYYFLVDDDVAFHPGDISRFFELCELHKLYISAPALEWGTNANHDVTLWNPLCEIRQVTYVEVMAPCFSRAAVDDMFDTFLLTKSTWGIDYAWSSLLVGQQKIAAVDAIRIQHTKAPDVTGGAFYEKLRSMGIDVGEEYGRIKRSYPSFGGFRTARRGHVYRFGLPDWLGWPLTRVMEHMNKRFHRWILSRRLATR